ncbi:hypothetical protein [Leptolyngbya sp. NIES-2104]|uniref:hypothetical protein n=1 Tax=Leptolyngbya sp. NIES-2104 TaxID=1552121 RepID=UPI0006ECA143|nr:hypothetical protein [Leptolyngbya sp. NIES-2104]GAP94200.1 hypothetical protein NIES2104_07110 [Leptolyngbya sp. NIES-2104]
MSGDEITPNNDAIELSDEELDQIDAGLSFQLVGGTFHRSRISVNRPKSISRAYHPAESSVEAETIESTGFQLTVIDATAEDLKVLSELFGNIDAIDGSA